MRRDGFVFKMVIKVGVVILVVGVIVGCGCGSKYLKKGVLRDTIDQEPVEGKYLEAIGIGAADPDIENTTQRRASSRNAAIVMAQYEMLSIVKGVTLEGGVAVEKAIETDSKIKSMVNDLIKGAEIIKTEWTKDDGCVITLRLPKKRLKKMMDVKFK